MKAQVLFDDRGHVHSMLLPTTRVGRPPAENPRAVFQLGPGQRSAELDVPAELSGLRLLEIHTAALVDLTGPEPRLVRNPAAPTPPLPPPRHV
jgi:hypothetical protein